MEISHYAGGIWKRRFHSENASNFSVHTTPEELKKATFAGYFEFVFEETRSITHSLNRSFPDQGNHVISVAISFSRNVPFLKFFPSTRKQQKPSVFEKLSFRDELLGTVRLA